MLHVMIGEKGTGKTARLIEAVHQAEAEAKGNVVFVNKGDRHIFDLTHRVRLVDTQDFKIATYDDFYGFICGMLAQNYDISHIFIDSITKIVNDDLNALEACLDRLNAISEQNKAEMLVIISMKPESVSEGIRKYL